MSFSNYEIIEKRPQLHPDSIFRPDFHPLTSGQLLWGRKPFLIKRWLPAIMSSKIYIFNKHVIYVWFKIARVVICQQIDDFQILWLGGEVTADAIHTHGHQ